MRLILTVVSGSDSGARLRVNLGEARGIGRAQQVDLRITDDLLISRSHFSVECSAVGGRIRDLGSTYGTFLNGRRVVEEQLADGDEIVAGQTKFRVRIESELSPPAPGFRGSQLAQGPVTPAVEPTRAAEGKAQADGASKQDRPRQAEPATAQVARVPSSVRRPYSEALADADSGVRREALHAAAWAREKWIVDHCALMARKPTVENWDAVLLLAILGSPSHLELISGLTSHVEIGARRFQILGAFGHPALIPLLLKGIAESDPETAAGAGAAFSKITGADIAADIAVAGPTAQPQADDAEPGEPMILPSPERALQHWKEVKDSYAKGTRWCRGFDLSGGVTDAIMAELDLASRWDACLRGRFEGTWRGSRLELELFPQTRPLHAGRVR